MGLVFSCVLLVDFGVALWFWILLFWLLVLNLVFAFGGVDCFTFAFWVGILVFDYLLVLGCLGFLVGFNFVVWLFASWFRARWFLFAGLCFSWFSSFRFCCFGFWFCLWVSGLSFVILFCCCVVGVWVAFYVLVLLTVLHVVTLLVWFPVVGSGFGFDLC